MIIKANAAYKNCEKEIKEIHEAVNKCIEDFIMPNILEKSQHGYLGYKFLLGDVASYYVSRKWINYAHPEGIAFYQQLIQKLEDYGYIVERDSTLIQVFWYKYQEDNNVNNSKNN